MRRAPWPTRWRGTPANLVELQRRTGREIVLALEPEPCCFLETIEETLAFFRDHLHADASAAIVAQATGLSLDAGARGAAAPSRRLLRHLPRRGGVRGPRRRIRATLRGRHPHCQAPAQLGAAAAGGRRRHGAYARGVRRRRLPASGGGAPERRDHALRRSRAGFRGAARRARPAANGACIATFRCSSRSPGSSTRRSRR